MKKILFLAVFIFCLCAAVYAEIIETESNVSKVIVYTDSAEVTRQAKVNVKEGSNEIVFTNVPENLNENTLTVFAKGTASAKILDAKIKRVFLEKVPSEAVAKLEDKIKETEDKISQLNYDKDVLKEEREFLKSIKLFSERQMPEDLITKMPALSELDALNNFLKVKWRDSYSNELAIEKELRLSNQELEKLRKELADIKQGQRNEKRLISIELEVEKAGSLLVSAGYLMYQARWYPEYDARVDSEKEQIELTCIGVVKQTSGEDWRDVECILSTAKPTVSGKMPELKSWILRPVETRIMKDELYVLSSMQMDKEKAWEEPAEALFEYTQAEEKLTSVNYVLTRPVTIKADGTIHRLPVLSREFAVEFQYAAVPKLSPYAYLTAEVTNEKEQLLPALVKIFTDNTYTGSSRIDGIGKGEKFKLSLGIDESVKIKREKIKEETKEIWIAGIKRKNKVVVTDYKITAENYKNKDIKISVFDQIPVSQNDQIVIKLLDATPKPDEENYEDRQGVMRWELSLSPKDKKEINFSYQVEYPRDMNIGL